MFLNFSLLRPCVILSVLMGALGWPQATPTAVPVNASTLTLQPQPTPTFAITTTLPGIAVAALHTVCDAPLFTPRGGANTIIREGGVFVNAPPGCNAINLASGNAHLGTTTLADCPNVDIPPGQTGGCNLTGAYPLTTSGMQIEGVNCATAPDWWSNPGSACNFYPAVQTGVPQMLTFTAPISTTDFTCGPARTTPAGGGTLLPGTYADGMNAGNAATLTLTTGIYCITGVGGTNNILNALNIIGHNVFIYIAVPVAELAFTGNTLDLTPITDCNALPELCPLVGVVLYKPHGLDTCNNTTIDLELAGNGSMALRGLIWAPQSYLAYIGNGNLSTTGQTLVGCVKYAGNGELKIIYENLRTAPTFTRWLPWVGGNPP